MKNMEDSCYPVEKMPLLKNKEKFENFAAC